MYNAAPISNIGKPISQKKPIQKPANRPTMMHMKPNSVNIFPPVVIDTD